MSALIFVLTTPIMSSSEAFGVGEIRFFYKPQRGNGPIRTLEGEVRIETASVVIRADKAVFNAATLDIAAAGHVHVQPKK